MDRRIETLCLGRAGIGVAHLSGLMPWAAAASIYRRPGRIRPAREALDLQRPSFMLMRIKMSHFDDLPMRNPNRDTEASALLAFEACVAESAVFELQGVDRHDYGTDCLIEVIDRKRATNVRVHVQVKGSEQTLNADGSLSISVDRTNLNYLLMNPHSFYVAYHLPTKSLRACSAESVLRQYEAHGRGNWTQQQTLTVSFTDALSSEWLARLAALAKADAFASRSRRTEQISAEVADVPQLLRNSAPVAHVPNDPTLAAEIALGLYQSGADRELYAAFDQFSAVLGDASDAMGYCHMAVINLGMADQGPDRGRLIDAVAHFRAKVGTGRFQRASLLYTIGNGLSALGSERDASLAYEAALAEPSLANTPSLAAQVHKNLGTSFERLGDQIEAVKHYQAALRWNPDLPEAHFALGIHHNRVGDYQTALSHLDRVVFSGRGKSQASAVAGWRINTLFNLGDARGAFRDINSILDAAGEEGWIWPWCANLVARFGRSTVGSAQSAAVFWQQYLVAHPALPAAHREFLLSKLYLRKAGHDFGQTFSEFCEEFDRHIGHVGPSDAALCWDRLGHWAQDDGDWIAAERCFRKAYELAGGHYGYCLGTALNFLSRYDEGLPLVLAQAERVQPDAMSWFQVAVAYEHLGSTREAIEAYKKALRFAPDYAPAMFNLGGLYWNSGKIIDAAEIWGKAVEKFSDHDVTARLYRDLPFLFDAPDRLSDG